MWQGWCWGRGGIVLGLVHAADDDAYANTGGVSAAVVTGIATVIAVGSASGEDRTGFDQWNTMGL